MHMDVGTVGFAGLRETPAETARSEPQAYIDEVDAIDYKAPQALTLSTTICTTPSNKWVSFGLMGLFSNILKCLVPLTKKWKTLKRGCNLR